MPAVRRTIPARLELCARDGECSVTDVLVYAAPPAAPFGRARVGWVGAPPPGRAGATPIEIERVSLGTATAISRFRGRTIVLAPGAGDVTPLVPALLGFARGGGTVLALGADAAPWVSEGRPPSPPPAGLLLYDLPPGALVRWGASDGIAKRPLRPPAGAHLELVPGLVRLAFVGEGCVLVARLRLVGALADEPLAALLVARLRAVVACAPWLHDFAARAPDASDGAFWRER